MTGPQQERVARARMPADVDAPDKVLYGLTFRQMAILAVAAVILLGCYRILHPLLPTPVLLVAGAVVGAMVFGVAVARRDGLPFDVWLTHAVKFSRGPRALTTMDTTTRLPTWVQPPTSRVMLPAPLRLPAHAITDDGDITLGGHTAAIVAATTVNLALRTADEQGALIEMFGRWLNSLTTPTQIVVSAQPVDLQTHADMLTARAERLPHPALSDACLDHAAFLTELAARRDPLRRQVLITTRTPSTGGIARAARRLADDTVRTLSGLGISTRALDGAAATAALANCADPYRPPRTTGLAAPHTTITARPAEIRTETTS
jgi:PrgI family protein